MTTPTPRRTGDKVTRSDHTHFLYYDIETVPDFEIPDSLTTDIIESVRVAKTKDADADAEKLEAKRAKVMDEFSLSPLTNRVVCIGFALNDEKPRAVYGKSERDLIDAFYTLVGEMYDRVQKNYGTAGRIIPVTYNGLSFDQHILFVKTVQHKLPLPRFNLRVPRFDKAEQHVDLRRVLTNDNQYARGTLAQWAIRFGYPLDIPEHDGSEIRELFNAGDFDAIRDKCKADVDIVRYVHKQFRGYL